MASDFEARIRNVTAVLGPTNTGKTHLAIERMLGHESGMIGLPLRLLAREVYDKVKARVGADKVALITGEEKIKPERARYWVSTVEAMPRDIDVEFLAIDEIQLAGDPERGHVFTDRMLHARGKSETLLLGAQTMREAISDLIPGANFISRPRLSKLSYAGEKKITRLPARSAIVAFSAQEVYAIAELIRRQRGGAAVVLGALSPRSRNAQVALYQSGDVEFLVATDAIGMGLNLDVDHVAFSALRKFDGHSHRNLTPGELGQIAGRAGRHMNDGTFGVTGSAEPLDSDMIERLESHTFDSIRVLQWRNRKLDFATLDRLHESLREMPREARLTRARTADDVAALEAATADREVRDMCATPAAVAKLWDVCQVPDYRKISGQNHAEIVITLYKFLMTGEQRIPEDWFSKQVAFADRTDGDIDTLSNRIAHIRTWTFVSNRPDWLKDPAHWQGRTRQVEDNLSDALHERLTQRFVDRRTSALMKGMRDKEELNAEIADDGAITVESHFVGRLKGFRFAVDASADGIHGKATRAAATQVLSRELGMRARRVAAAGNDAFKLTRQGRILWREDEIGKLEPAEDPLAPTVSLLADEHLSEADREKVQARLQTWMKDTIADKLKPLVDMSNVTDLQGLARGVAFRLKENFGVLKRDTVAEEISALDQPSRADLRKHGLRFGAFNIHFPPMLKPAPAELTAILWSLKHGAAAGIDVEQPPALPRPGLTSVAADGAVPEALYRANGYHLCGPRAVRLDILERLADLIRPLLAWRTNPEKPEMPPKGSTGDGGFKVTDEMMSILGTSAEELSHVLKALGFRLERRPLPKAAAAVEPAPKDSTAAAEGDAMPPSTVAMEPEPAATIEAVAEATETSGPADAAGPAPETTSVPPVEDIKYEEIWRPRRHQRQEHKGRREGREGGAERRDRGQHRRGGKPGGSAVAVGAVATGAGEAAAAAPDSGQKTETAAPVGETQNRHHRDRDRPRSDRANRDSRAEAGPQAPRPRPDRDRGDAKGRGDRERPRGGPGHGPGRGDRGRRDEHKRQPEVITASPPKRAGVDPDSPFAKLAALKAALDKRGQEPGSR
jgi:ATP-dependent RNA helicase SUPV3L1/SUV3